MSYIPLPEDSGGYLAKPWMMREMSYYLWDSFTSRSGAYKERIPTRLFASVAMMNYKEKEDPLETTTSGPV